MKIKLLTIGKLKSLALTELAADYSNRIQKLHPFELIEIPAESFSEKITPEKVLRREAEKLKKHIKSQALVFCLDERGKEFTSIEFSKILEREFLSTHFEIIFVLGGAQGLAETFKKEFRRHLSLSKLTLPHRLARVFFLEQLYRALTIIRKMPYHHE